MNPPESLGGTRAVARKPLLRLAKTFFRHFVLAPRM